MVFTPQWFALRGAVLLASLAALSACEPASTLPTSVEIVAIQAHDGEAVSPPAGCGEDYDEENFEMCAEWLQPLMDEVLETSEWSDVDEDPLCCATELAAMNYAGGIVKAKWEIVGEYCSPVTNIQFCTTLLNEFNSAKNALGDRSGEYYYCKAHCSELAAYERQGDIRREDGPPSMAV